jgi:hypothetical protein
MGFAATIRPMPAGLLKFSHLIFATLYLALPPVVLILATARRVRVRYWGRHGAVGVLFSSGIVLGAAVAISHSLVAGAPVSLEQVIVAGYFAIGLLLIIRGLDWTVAMALGLGPAGGPSSLPVSFIDWPRCCGLRC